MSVNKQFKNDEHLLRKRARRFIDKYLSYEIIEKFQQQTSNVLHSVSDISYNLESLLIILEFIDSLQFEIIGKKELLTNLQKTKKIESTNFNKIIFALNEKENLLNKQFNSLRDKEIRVAIREKIANGILNNRITNIKSIISKDYYKNPKKTTKKHDFNIQNSKNYKLYSLFDKIISQHQKIENLRLENLYIQSEQREKKNRNRQKTRVKKTNSANNINNKQFDFSNQKSIEKRKKDFLVIRHDKIPIQKMNSVDNNSKNVLSLSFSQKDNKDNNQDNNHITYDYIVNDFEFEDERRNSFEKEINNVVKRETIKNDLKEKIRQLIKSRVNNSKDNEILNIQDDEYANYNNTFELSFRNENGQKKSMRNIKHQNTNEEYSIIKKMKNHFNESNIQSIESKREQVNNTNNSEKNSSINIKRLKLYQNLFFSEKILGAQHSKNCLELFLNSKRNSMEINDKGEFINQLNSNSSNQLNEKRNNQKEEINYRIKNDKKEEELISNKDDQGNIVQSTQCEIEDNDKNKKYQEEKQEKEIDKEYIISNENLTKKSEDKSNDIKKQDKIYEEASNKKKQTEISNSKNNTSKFEDEPNIINGQPLKTEPPHKVPEFSNSKHINQINEYIKYITVEKDKEKFENSQNYEMKSNLIERDGEDNDINCPHVKVMDIQEKAVNIPRILEQMQLESNDIDSQLNKNYEKIQPQDINNIKSGNTIRYDNKIIIHSDRQMNESQMIHELVKMDETNLINLSDKIEEKNDNMKEILNEEKNINSDNYDIINITNKIENNQTTLPINNKNKKKQNSFDEKKDNNGIDNKEIKIKDNSLQNVSIKEESAEILKKEQIDNKETLSAQQNKEILQKDATIPSINNDIKLDDSFGSKHLICQPNNGIEKKSNLNKFENIKAQIIHKSEGEMSQNAQKNIKSNQDLLEIFDNEELLNQDECQAKENNYKKKVMFMENHEQEQKIEEKDSLLFSKIESIPLLDSNQLPLEVRKVDISQPVNSLEVINDSLHSSPIIKSLSQRSNSGQFIMENEQLSQLSQFSQEKKQEKTNNFDSNQNKSKKENSSLFFVPETQYNIYYDDNSEYSRKTAYEPAKRPYIYTGEDNNLILSKEQDFCINQNLRKTAMARPFKRPLIKPGIKEFDFWGLFNFWDKKKNDEKPRLILPVIKSNLAGVIIEEKIKKGYEKIKTLIMKKLQNIYFLIKRYDIKKQKLYELFWKYSKKKLYINIIIKIFVELKVKNDNFIFSTISEDMINSREDINYTNNLKEIQKITKETKIIEANLAKFTNEIGVKSKL